MLRTDLARPLHPHSGRRYGRPDVIDPAEPTTSTSSIFQLHAPLRGAANPRTRQILQTIGSGWLLLVDQELGLGELAGRSGR